MNTEAMPLAMKQNTTSTDDRWLSISEICEHLGVSNDTVYKWIDKHEMPAHRMGRLWKFKKADVDDWVKSGGSADKTMLPNKAPIDTAGPIGH